MGDLIQIYGRYNFRRNRTLYLMLLPFMIIFFTFTVAPVAFSVFASFTAYDVLNPPRFIGFDNFRRLFVEDDMFLRALQNTFLIAVLTGPTGYMIAFIMAWLINEVPRKLRAVLTIIFYAPSMGGNAFVLFLFLFSNDAFGWANSWLMSIGLINEPRLWLSEPSTMWPILVGISLWMSLGFGFLSFVAGLQTIDRAQYEAAYVDGISNRWQELWFITLPNMKPQLMFGAVMSITGAFGAGAMGSMLFGFPSPHYATHTMVNHLEDFGSIRMEMGYASAIALILLAVMLTANKLVQRFLRKVGT